mgnify:CR=1 FL=1
MKDMKQLINKWERVCSFPSDGALPHMDFYSLFG